MDNRDATFSVSRSVTATNYFFQQVYLWMTVGLAVTALASFLMLSSQAAQQFIFGNKMIFYGLIFAELGLVIAISAAINRISAATATLLFVLYSALNGVTFAAIFLMYTSGSIVSTFIVTAGTFGSMSLYGYVTKRDLTGMGSFMFMG
ncbi:MAG: Bax inhibitor-1/YccA family protein, partial [Deltaproteobacteria bacterium]|nr:Bax inhibitor-1/YccA family protein [Deltaproteobacteria bacterium]